MSHLNPPIADPVELQRTIADEFFRSMGVSAESWQRKLFGPLVDLPTRRFSHMAATFDQQVSREGLPPAARTLLSEFVGEIGAIGNELVPQQGPLLVVSNHPGAYDVLVIAANLQRDDLKILVSAIPFAYALPATATHMIYTSLTETQQRMTVVREAVRHLRDGHALLIFASGQLDPDPAFMPGASEALRRWSPSLEIFLRQAPQTQFQPAIVQGVLVPGMLNNPIVKRQKGAHEVQRLAEFFQVARQLVTGKKYNIHPQVLFGYPVPAGALLKDAENGQALARAVKYAQQLLAAGEPVAFKSPGENPEELVPDNR